MRVRGVALLLLIGAPLALAAQQGSRYTTTVATAEATLVELRIGRLASKTLSAYRRGDEALLPVREVLRLAEIASADLSATRLAFRSIQTSAWTVIDLVPTSARRAKGDRTLPEGSILIVATEPYVSNHALAVLLGTDLQVDWEDLTVTVMDAEALPIAQRVRREALRRSAMSEAAEPEAPLLIASPRARLDGLVIDYAIATPLQRFASGETAWSVGLGSEAMGGGLTATLAHGAGSGNRLDLGWLRAWSGSQLALGDAISTGPHTRSVRGFAFSNAPLARADDYGLLPFGGNIAPGWDVEAWRGGRLVAEDSADATGRFRLDVPVQYGENAVEFVAYGPFGEVRRFSRAWGIHPDAVAPGRVTWGVAGGACRAARCDATLNADLRIGVVRGWTARAGVERFWRHTSADLSHPYFALYGTVTAGIDAEFTAVSRAVTQASLTWSPALALRTSLTAARYDTTLADPMLTTARRRDQLTATIGWRHGSTSLDAAVEHFRASEGTSLGGRLALSTTIGRLQWLASVRAEKNHSATGPRIGALTAGLDAFAASLGAGILRRATIRAGIDVSGRDGAQQLRIATGLPLSSAIRVETGMSWQAGQRGTRFSVLVVGDLPSVRATTSVDFSRASTVQQTVQGSLLVDHTQHHLIARALPALSRGGISGRACIDEDGNGVCAQTEPGLPGLRIIAAGVATTTDSAGRWSLWDLAPYTPTRVTIDTTSLSAPYLVPPFRDATVTPSANRFVALDIPVIVGGIAEGMAQRADGTGVAGLLLRLTRKDGSERVALRTFTDGGFYAVGLRPGEWRVIADARELATMGLVAAPLMLHIGASTDGAVADGLRLRLDPATTASR